MVRRHGRCPPPLTAVTTVRGGLFLQGCLQVSDRGPPPIPDRGIPVQVPRPGFSRIRKGGRRNPQPEPGEVGIGDIDPDGTTSPHGSMSPCFRPPGLNPCRSPCDRRPRSGTAFLGLSRTNRPARCPASGASVAAWTDVYGWGDMGSGRWRWPGCWLGLWRRQRSGSVLRASFSRSPGAMAAGSLTPPPPDRRHSACFPEPPKPRTPHRLYPEPVRLPRSGFLPRHDRRLPSR